MEYSRSLTQFIPSIGNGETMRTTKIYYPKLPSLFAQRGRIMYLLSARGTLASLEFRHTHANEQKKSPSSRTKTNWIMLARVYYLILYHVLYTRYVVRYLPIFFVLFLRRGRRGCLFFDFSENSGNQIVTRTFQITFKRVTKKGETGAWFQ